MSQVRTTESKESAIITSAQKNARKSLKVPIGGVPGWLIDDVNGHLAPADPPTAEGLAHAISRCLRGQRPYMRLKRGAVEMAARFNRSSHLDELSHVFDQVLRVGNSATTKPATPRATAPEAAVTS